MMINNTTKNIPKFPVHQLIPKIDTQASGFLQKYPQYDGKGTVIAILDTGIDPGTPGLQVTSDGKPKIIDIVDCTGGGDVETTKVVKPEIIKRDNVECTVIKGLSGKDLIIDPSWSCPSQEFRVGLKPSRELFPIDLVERLNTNWRKKLDIEHQPLLTEALDALRSFDKEHPTLTDEAMICQRADLEARVDQLKDLASSYSDPGKVFDCVVFFDGSDWRAVIDVDGSGDLRGQPCLTDYKKEHQFHTFGEEDLLNFSVNIYQDGDLLSIVTDIVGHGTHVASIAAANFPEEPALNGVAPGAQLVSLRIERTELDVEMSIGMTRAAAYLAKHSIDLVNMSYSEPSSIPTGGHFVELLSNEVVGKSGCIFVTSAGNDGPCYGTINAPGGMSDALISVGAYVRHSQVIDGYLPQQSTDEMPYTQCSRGPCNDGYQGVNIYAPGNALTNSPVYSLKKMNFSNGTSMASPNVCGCLALLVSGLKAKNIKVTPYRVKNAMVQTAKDVDDPMQVGFIQVEKAWEYLENVKDRDDRDILFKVNIFGDDCNYRGIYLREKEETTKPQYCKAMIQPTYMKDRDNEKDKDYMYNRHKSQYEARVALIATESWIQAPEYVYLNSSGEIFEIKVDPTALPENGFHYGEVRGYDTTAPDIGPLFRIPVTVIKPMSPRNGSIRFKGSEYDSGDIIRQFVHVPEGSTYCRLTLCVKSQQQQQQSGFVMLNLHMLQVTPHKSPNNQKLGYFSPYLASYSERMYSEEHTMIKRFAVHGGRTMELCLEQVWSGYGQYIADIQLEFHGIQVLGAPSPSQGVLRLNPDITCLEIAAPVRTEVDVPLYVRFDKIRRYLSPSNATIHLMPTERNTLPNSKILYGLVLTYTFTVDFETQMTPHFPIVKDQIYESFLAGVFGSVYDTHGRSLGKFQVFDQEIYLKQGGEYTIKLQLFSGKEDVLQKLKTMVCELNTSMTPTYADFYQHPADIYDKDLKNRCNYITLECGRLAVRYVAPPGKIPSEARPGDALVGTLKLCNDHVCAGEYNVLYVVPPRPVIIGPTVPFPEPQEAQIVSDLNDDVLDLQLSRLQNLSIESDSYKWLMDKIKYENSDNVKFIEYQIYDLWEASKGSSIGDSVYGRSLTAEEGESIIYLADKMLEATDHHALMEFKVRDRYNIVETSEVKEKRKEMMKQETILKDALTHKIAAQMASHEAFEDTFKVLEAYMTNDDTSDDPLWVLIRVQRERDARRFGTALRLIRQYLADVHFLPETSDDVVRAWSLCRQIYDDLGWTVWANLDDREAFFRKPPCNNSSF